MIARTIALPQGRVRQRVIAVGNTTAMRVRGIPIARVERRFLPPVHGVAWEGIRDDDPHPAVAPQHLHAFRFDDPGPVIGDGRECIHASVWSPVDVGGLPVLVWLHGGGGFAGSSTERDAGALAVSLGAVVIALSFRVGALGHLHLGHDGAGEYADSGNTGLHDIRVGLEWVRRNVEHFGGDASRVTLAGQSAGAAMVATVLATEWGATLVSRAIMQSGTAERVHTVAQANAVASVMSASMGGVAQLISRPEADVVAAQGRLLQRASLGAWELPTPFRPVLGVPSLVQSPLQAFEQGAAEGIPLLIGTNLREAALMASVLPAARRASENADSGYRSALERARRSGLEVGDDSTAWCTDRAYRQPTERILSARLSAPAPTYAYLFTGTPQAAPVHNAELDLLFSPGDESEVSQLAVLWRDFIHGDREVLGEVWAPMGPGRDVAVIGERVRMQMDPLGTLRDTYRDPER
ncbi:carboxylesterase family protein [Microbacterium sp. UFMG61]|uniref:carboxylesterase family protein n=1 Tax=Microbacterium sp. UFMG61 TaxID=2745935 RepID=UPI0018907FED|nr:carboxylesterase family protein [Microbacterium sp. UFMG61]